MLFWRMDLKHLTCKLFLFAAALLAAWTAFPVEKTAFEAYLHRFDGETVPYPPRFQKVLVLFSADTTKEDRDAFLAGLEEVRLRHLKDYHELVRKWWEIRETESEKDLDEAAWDRFTLEQEFERDFYHNPWFLKLVDVQMVRTDKAFFPLENAGPVFDPRNDLSSPLWDLNSLDARGWGIRHELWSDFWDTEGPIFADAEALIVVASDRISAAVNRMIQDGSFTAPLRNDVVVLFAGVSSFDESVRGPTNSEDKPEDEDEDELEDDEDKSDGAIDPAKAPYAFSIQYSSDPWPNTELALSMFPKTKKVILLTPPLSSRKAGNGVPARTDKLWNEEKETAFRAKLGPGKTLKTISISEVDEAGRTEADIAEIKRRFAASVKAEIQPDTVIVSMSSVEKGLDPVSWLPDKFIGCPVFADTVPVHPSSVGGFCRSMEKLGVQAAELLEQLTEAPLNENKLPPSVLEDDDLWLNEAALKRYGLNAADFPEAILMNTNSSQRPRVRFYSSWSKKRIALLLAANAAVLFGLYLFALVSIRAAKRTRLIDDMIYGALPVRVIVVDRDGRIIARHKQYGEVEQEGEFPWKNIEEVPWLRDIRALDYVREAFDSGKTVVHRLEIDGQHRIVVLSRTSSDILGRPVVIAVSSDSPSSKSQA